MGGLSPPTSMAVRFEEVGLIGCQANRPILVGRNGSNIENDIHVAPNQRPKDNGAAPPEDGHKRSGIHYLGTVRLRSVIHEAFPRH